MNFNRLEDSLSEDSWLSFYINLGRSIYERNISEHDKINVCISIPFLNFISTAIGLGICDSLYTSVISKNENDILKEFKPGTLIFYHSPFSKKEKAFTFEGYNTEGHPIILSKGKNPETVTLTQPELWRNIRVAPEQVKYKRNRTIRTSNMQSAIYNHYEREHIDNILRKSQINILFIGNEKRLKEEMSYELEKGHSLSEWLLPKSMYGAQSSYISDIVSPGTRIESISLSPNTILIFDGVQAFTQSWYRKLPNPCIILLERTASVESLISGLDLMSSAIDSKNVSVADEFMEVVASFPVVPGNIELTAWSGGE